MRCRVPKASDSMALLQPQALSSQWSINSIFSLLQPCMAATTPFQWGSETQSSSLTPAGSLSPQHQRRE